MELSKQTPAYMALEPEIRAALETLTDEQFIRASKAMHGVLISQGMVTKQLHALSELRKLIPDIEHIDGTWDFVSHERKLYVDSKSPGYNGNVFPEDQTAKYRNANTQGYRMVFVVVGDGAIKWPVVKYAELGIEVMKLNKFLKEL